MNPRVIVLSKKMKNFKKWKPATNQDLSCFTGVSRSTISKFMNLRALDWQPKKETIQQLESYFNQCPSLDSVLSSSKTNKKRDVII